MKPQFPHDCCKPSGEHLNESSQARNGSWEPGGKRKKEGGRRKKEGARKSVFTNMRCSHRVRRRSRNFEHKIELKRRERIIRNPSSDLRNYSVIGPLTTKNNLRSKKRNNFSLFQTSDDRPMLITKVERSKGGLCVDFYSCQHDSHRL